MTEPLTTVVISREHDVVLARQRARQVAALLGLDEQDRVRVATAVSELARNAFEYAGGGNVDYLLAREARDELVVRVSDRGPGIGDLEAVLEGRYGSKTGMGLGIVGARRLMDRFTIESAPGAGTTVVVAKMLPAAQSRSERDGARVADALARQAVESPLGELQHQNQELVRTLEELQARQEELARLNRELEETNRGVVALYAELDERAEELRRSSETKSRFLSSVSHELRTPLSSILALCDLLLDRADGPLTDEQQRQVDYIRAGGESLLTLVNDLLDLARIEAGKTSVHATTFEVENLFASLRGMFRPLHRNERVALVFDDVAHLPSVHTDESKLAQVLRNFISNALKFTEEGEVRVSGAVADQDRAITFFVSDTGVGIPPADLDRIFEEFVQVEAAQHGTGLGLSVSRRLARLLGGDVAVESQPGAGSTFRVTVPTIYAGTDRADVPDRLPAPAREQDLEGLSVVVVDDEETARYIARRALAAHGCRVVDAVDGAAGVRAAREELPDAVVLDLKMPGADGFSVLRQLRDDAATAGIPVIVHTALRLSEDERARLEREADALLDKHEAGGEALAATVADVIVRSRVHD
jgi:signal transduction histidine kinase